VLWKLEQLLTAVVLGVMAGCHGLHELEQLTELLSPAMRRRLGIKRRMPDTTVRDVLCALSVDELRAGLHRMVRAAIRRKALVPTGLPFGVLALDGKCTSLPCWDDRFVQKHHPETGLPYGIARTVTCTLVSAAGRPCVDAIPIPPSTNEMGWFPQAFDSVVAAFPSLFRLVTYDAGALSEANASHVVQAGKDYLLHVKGDQRTMFKLADELLVTEAPVALTIDKPDKRTRVTRRLTLLRANAHWGYGNGKHPADSIWRHARTFLRVEYVVTRDEMEVTRDERVYVSSLDPDVLSPEQWLLVVRSHWGVEVTHNLLDTAMLEDDRPWIVSHATGMMATLVLRRIAYTLLALFRSVSLRSETGSKMRWKDLLRWVHTALVASTEHHLSALRPRKVLSACR
jgi:hypothetical protein